MLIQQKSWWGLQMSNKYLILGATSDLGRDLINKIIEKENSGNATIIAHYNSSSGNLDHVVENRKVSVVKYKADMSNLKEVRKMIEWIKNENLIPNHIVSFCAMPFCYKRMSEWDSDCVNKDMTIQVYSFAEILSAFLPEMAKNRYGKIVTLLTACTIGIPPKNMSGYVTVKYALLALVKSVANDYGDQGININGISPGMIETKFLKNIGRKVKEISAESNPRHRNLIVTDVTPTIMMLLSNDADFINGANINLSATPG